jgi:hypothetical protein
MVDGGLHNYCKSTGKRYETLLSSEITHAVKCLHLLAIPMARMLGIIGHENVCHNEMFCMLTFGWTPCSCLIRSTWCCKRREQGRQTISDATRYTLLEVNRIRNCSCHWNVTDGGHTTLLTSSRRSVVCLMASLHTTPVMLCVVPWTVCIGVTLLLARDALRMRVPHLRSVVTS